MELSSITKPNTSSGSATPNTIFSNVIKSAVGGATASSNKEQPDLFDMLISPPEKNAKNQVKKYLFLNFLLFFFSWYDNFFLSYSKKVYIS